MISHNFINNFFSPYRNFFLLIFYFSVFDFWRIFKPKRLSISSYHFKGTVNVLSKIAMSRCTTVPLKALSDRVINYNSVLLFFKTVISICGFSAKVTIAHFLLLEKLENSKKNYFRSTKVSFTFLIRVSRVPL